MLQGRGRPVLTGCCAWPKKPCAHRLGFVRLKIKPWQHSQTWHLSNTWLTGARVCPHMSVVFSKLFAFSGLAARGEHLCSRSAHFSAADPNLIFLKSFPSCSVTLERRAIKYPGS